MKKLNVQQMVQVEGGLNKYAAFGCGVGIAFIIANPLSAFAIGEATGVMCALSLAD